MDKILRPERLDTDPNSSGASKVWLHWKKTFQHFLAALNQERLDKLGVLTNYLSPNIYQYIEDCADYDSAMGILQELYVKPTNEVYARLDGRTYSSVCLSILPDLCSDVILGIDFPSQHACVVFKHGGPNPPLSVCGVSTLNTDPPRLFSNLTDDCHPISPVDIS